MLLGRKRAASDFESVPETPSGNMPDYPYHGARPGAKPPGVFTTARALEFTMRKPASCGPGTGAALVAGVSATVRRPRV